MRQSVLFTKTRKEAPRDEVSKNAILLTRAGFIHKEQAGVYSYLPLGLKVLKKIENIIREEMDNLGAQELLLTALQDKNVWIKTSRWDDAVLDTWFKTTLKSGGELGLATTHEEPLSELLRDFISSYRDLPVSTYQFQTKFRNELRAKSGILRGREFLMKDLYSFSRTEDEHDEFYERAQGAYTNIFERVGIGDYTYLTFASGGTFSKFSHEFQAITPAGEDTIYVSDEKRIAINKEVMEDSILSDLGVKKEDLKEVKAIEVGNIFSLGTRFSEAASLEFTDEKGIKRNPIMGCYGIGLGRLMGTIVEVLSDEKGIVWPEAVAPYQVHLISIGDGKMADGVYSTLQAAGAEVLYDDRDLRAGEKFNDADLIGIPTRVIVGEKAKESGKLEVRNRRTGEVEELSMESLLKKLGK